MGRFLDRTLSSFDWLEVFELAPARLTLQVSELAAKMPVGMAPPDNELADDTALQKPTNNID